MLGQEDGCKETNLFVSDLLKQRPLRFQNQIQHPVKNVLQVSLVNVNTKKNLVLLNSGIFR